MKCCEFEGLVGKHPPPSFFVQGGNMHLGMCVPRAQLPGTYLIYMYDVPNT